MRKMILFLLFLRAGLVFACPDISELRILYYKAALDKNTSGRFIKVVEEIDNRAEPLFIGYKGVAYVISAQYCFNPCYKYSHFNKGRELIESAIKRDSVSVELRFLRLCVEINAPYFLGYHNDIERDKLYILSKWKTVSDADLKKRIKSYLVLCGRCNKNEKMILYG